MRPSNFRRLPLLSSGSSEGNDSAGFAAFCVSLWLRSEAIFLQATIQRAAAEAKCFGGAVGVAFKPRERLLDQESLSIFETHLFEACGQTRVRCRFEREIESRHDLPGTHQHRALDHVVQLTH